MTQLGVRKLQTFLIVLTFVSVSVGCDLQLVDQIDDESKKIKAQVEEIGLNKIIIRSVPPKKVNKSTEAKQYGLTRTELRLLLETIPTIAKSSVSRVVENQVIYSGRPDDKKKHHYKIVGCTAEHFADSKIEVANGHSITQRAIESKSNVCVLSAKAAAELFLDENPIGKTIYLPTNRIFLRVVGVMKKRKARESLATLPSRDFSREIYIPITTMRARLGDIEVVRDENRFTASTFEISQAILTVKNVKDVEKTAKLIESTLKKENKGRTDIEVFVPLRVLKKNMDERK